MVFGGALLRGEDDLFGGEPLLDHGQNVLGVGDYDFEHVGTVMCNHFFEGLAQIFAFDDAASGNSEAFRDFHEVGIEGVDIVGASDVIFVAEDGLAADAVIHEVLPLNHHSEVLIVEDDGLRVDFFDLGGAEFLHVHEETAVAVDVDNEAVRAGDFYAEGGGKAEAHGAETEGTDVGAGFAEFKELRRPHLVLPHTGGDDGVAFGDVVEGFDGLLLRDVLALFVAEGVLRFPLIAGGEPFAEVGFLKFSLFGDGAEARKGVFDVRVNRQRDALVLVVFGNINVDVDDFRVGCEFIDLAGDAVIKAGTGANEEVAIANRPVAGDGAVHPKPIQGERVFRIKGAQSHESGGHRNTGELGKFTEFFMGFAGDDTTADVENGAFGFCDEIQNRSEFLVACFWRGDVLVVAGKIDLRREGGFKDGLLNVLGDVDHDWPGATGAGDVKRFFNDAGEVFLIEHEVRVLHDRERHAVKVGLLESGLADELLVDLSGDRNERDAVHESVGDTGNEICGTGAAGCHTDRRFSGDAGMSVRHETTALFKARQDRADLFTLGERLVQFQRGTSRICIHHIHALAFKRGDHDIGALHFRTYFVLLWECDGFFCIFHVNMGVSGNG